MTKEQAIEKCKKIINTNDNVVKEARRVRDINTMQLVASLDDESIAIETVLNMLKEKDKEIEKKDKIIDLMAEQLIRVPINKSKRNFEEPNFEEEIIIFADKEYIKQYFERKVEDE